MEQYGIAVRWPWGQLSLWQNGSALICFGPSSLPCTGLLCCSSRTISVFYLPSLVFQLQGGEKHSSVFNGQGKCALRERGVLTYIARSLPTQPPSVSDGFILIKTRTPNPHSLSGPKDTVLIGHNGDILIGRWRGWVDGDIAPIGGGRPQSYWMK